MEVNYNFIIFLICSIFLPAASKFAIVSRNVTQLRRATLQSGICALKASNARRNNFGLSGVMRAALPTHNRVADFAKQFAQIRLRVKPSDCRVEKQKAQLLKVALFAFLSRKPSRNLRFGSCRRR